MDEIDDLLTPRPLPAPPEQDVVWRATTRAIARRRWARRGQWCLALAACYLAGVATLWWHTPVREAPMQVAWPEQPVEAPPRRTVEEIYAHNSPRSIEQWAANQPDDKRRTMYRLAGDRFLYDGDDPAALRCYRKALDGGPPAEMAINTNDSWLMMSLKRSIHKE